MSEASHKAVFLSYASQDAEAAKKICDALRAAGMEVWFDQDELVGGDAWDQKIRRHIKECELLIPVISAATQARTEGYFRLEWRLADQRTHLMARGRPFLLPVVIDDTRDADAHVPDSFTEVQWTRLPGGETPPAFVERVKKLLSGEVDVGRGHRTPPAAEKAGFGDPALYPKAKPIWLWVLLALVVALPAYCIFKPRRSPEEVARLLAQVQAMADKAEKTAMTTVPAVPVTESPKPAEPKSGAETTPVAERTPAIALPVAAEKSVAVLAFANLSDDKGNEYFSDGISEELLNVLAKIPGLKVTARTSAFYFKGKDVTAAEIARQLGVAYLVEGSVRKSGTKVRIAAQLIKASDGFEVWSDHFDRELTDVFAVQDEIAGVIARNFQLKVGEVPVAERTVNPEAHQLYLQGRYFLNQFTLASATHAERLLQHAIELDPAFARAWAALAFAGIMRGGYGNTRQEVDAGYDLARRAAERALALDPHLAVAYVTLSGVQISREFNWQGAAESLHRAQELEPANVEVIDGLGALAYSRGELDRAAELDAQAVALDPVNTSLRVDHGFSLNALKRYPEAEAEFRRTIELNPAAQWGHAGLSFSFAVQGRYDEAEGEALQETSEWSRLFTLALAQWGQKKVPPADATLAQLVRVYGDVAAYQIAEVYAFRHDHDRAFEWLDRAYRQRDPGLIHLRPDPLMAGLRTDPRWVQLLRKIGLADEQLK